MAGHGTFYWNELMTRDVEGAKAFFAATLGWTFDAMPMPGFTYHVAKSGDQAVGGIMDMAGMAPDDVPPHWMSYIDVDDVDARVAKAKAAGAEVMAEPFDVAGVGRIAIVKDPTGAVVGWITPAST